jgi:AraC-like DNA-binding protein
MIFQDEDLCIDNWSVFNREILYQAYFQDYYDSVDKCYADFNIPDFKEYKLIKGRNGVNKLFYISHALMERPVFIVMEFDFKDFISYTETENYGKFLLTDNENNVIFSNSGDKSPALPAYKADRQTVRNLNQGENIIGYIKSDVFPGTYVHIVEKSLYYKATLLTNKIIYISFFFCLAFSVFLAFYLAKRNSGTMDKLINKIELDEANVSKREQTLKDIFFYNFILNKISYNEKDMTHFTADFKEKYYAAALFNVTDFGVHENDSDRGKMALFNISNVFSELMSELAVCYYCEVDGLYFCLLNMKKEDLAKENITEKLRFTNEFLNRNVGMSFVYIVSGVYVSLEETPRVYLKMQDELSSKYIWGGEAETESHDGRIDEIKKYVDGNFMNGNLSVAEIADYFGLSFNYISKYFKAYTGVGLARYIVCRRVDEAKILLRQTNENLNVIAEKTGFYSTSAFIRTFKKIENMTPGQFRG